MAIMRPLRAALHVLTAAVLSAGAGSCDRALPSAPRPPLSTTSSNQAPQLTAGPVSPSVGIYDVTTFTVRVEVRDPDGDPVSLKMSGCPRDQDVPIPLESGATTVSFIATGACASPLRFTATDARGAASETPVSFQTFRMKGAFRFVLGEGIYAQPAYGAVLNQSGSVITGTIHDFRGHYGSTDPHEPGTIDADGRFRIRFKIQSEADLLLSGQVTSAITTFFDYVLVGRGTVLADAFAGRSFELWHEAMY